MKRIFLILCMGLTTAWAVAQTLVTINNKAISVDEFEYYYQKNNQNQAQQLSRADYINMFVNFKLKVEEAYAQQYDTVSAFQNELQGYRQQLVGPYLTDSVKRNELVQEAYKHFLEDIEVSHILFRIDFPNEAPLALEKAQKARKRLKKEDFAKVAVEVSEDPSVVENKGYLGYTTGGQFVYPFERAAYNLKVGEISQPIRTSFGYHIIKLHNRRPSKGEVQLAHIFKAIPEYADSTQQIAIEAVVMKLYQTLLEGADFAALARNNSEDDTAAKGGKLPWLGIGMSNPWIENAAFALTEIGEISEPVHAPYGWHIFQLLDKRPVRSLYEYRPMINTQINMDERRAEIHQSFVDKLKKEYKFKKSKKAGIIATFADQVLTQEDLDKFCQERPHGNDSINDFINYSIYQYENKHLESKYPEFGMLMNEYKEGILLFNICNDLIWSKASKDKEGLKQFFENNKENYPADYTYNKGPVVNDYQTYLEEQWLASLHEKYEVSINYDVLNKIK